jgi:hypothetical protein
VIFIRRVEQAAFRGYQLPSGMILILALLAAIWFMFLFIQETIFRVNNYFVIVFHGLFLFSQADIQSTLLKTLDLKIGKGYKAR